jgi:hypothetical protein
MMFLHVKGSPKDLTDQSMAKTLVDLVVWQAKQAAIDEIHARAHVDAIDAAMMAANVAYQNSEELGFGPRLPHTEYEIKVARQQLEDAKLNAKQHNALVSFVTGKIVEKFVG